MAKFTIIFEDEAQGGMKANIELRGFEGSNPKVPSSNTLAQNLFFLISNAITSSTGLDIPEYKPDKPTGESHDMQARTTADRI